MVLIADIFGIDLLNTKLQADSWAQDGWRVLVPDIFEGDVVSPQHLKVRRAFVEGRTVLSEEGFFREEESVAVARSPGGNGVGPR